MKKLKQILTGLKIDVSSILLTLSIIGLVVIAFFIGLSNSKKETIYIKPNYTPYIEEIHILKKIFEDSNRKIDSLNNELSNALKTKKVNKKITNDKIEVVKSNPIDSTVLLLRARYN